MVFKNKINIKNESINITKSTNLSGIINDNQPLKEISEFKKGNCWVQDLSSMLPIHLTSDLNNLKALEGQDFYKQGLVPYYYLKKFKSVIDQTT